MDEQEKARATGESDARLAAEMDARLAAGSDARLAAESDARLAAVFRAAAEHAPPPGFDAGDVVNASRRITRRRRAAVAGAALAVLAAVGVGTTVGGPGGGTDLTTAAGGSAPALAPAAPAAPDQRADAVPEDAVPEDAVPEAAGPEAAAPAPGAAGSEGAGPAPVPAPGPAVRSGAPPVGPPLGPGAGECADRQDPALRALVEQALPEVVGAPEAATTTECRPGGERGVALEVRDVASSGLLSVTSLPAGATARVDDEARTAPTASGGTVVVSARASRPGDPAPFAARLDAVLAYLGPRL